ncbi:MAG: hypothetical protein HFE64_02415 [Lachnospiraceae bacterium]|jgi:asparagine synthase (glutamine-hydrolysing)|nr:hypothetical protein [Lachnospiraceae bacterium]
MPGFFISSIKGITVPDNEYQSKCIKQEIANDKYVIQRNTLDKYLDDKVFFENDKVVIILEGVILNKTELCQKYGDSDFTLTVLKMREERETEFFNDFRGSFSGAVLDKKKDEWLIFTDHIGRSLYWFQNELGFIVGSEIRYISQSMQRLGLRRDIEKAAFDYMFVYGCMIDKRTQIKNVYRVMPGHYLTIANGKAELNRYHRMSNKPNTAITEDEAIETFDRLFLKAMKRIIDKDKEYGYQTIYDLSGGLDSRAICFTAKRLGVKNALTFSFGQSGSTDQTIAQDIASYLGYTNIFYSIDNAAHLYDIDQIIRMNGGSCYYAGNGAYKRWIELLDTKKIGLSVNGVFGDIYEGAHLFNKTNDGYLPIIVNERKKCLSHLLDINLDESCTEGFENIELFLSYTRDMLGNMNTALTKQNAIEVMSPFGDIDFLSFFYSLSREMRIEERIGIKWQNKKNPDAMRFIYATTGLLPDASQFRVNLHRFPFRVKKKLMSYIGRNVKSVHDMNPFAYWYASNPDFRVFFTNYWRDNNDCAKQSPEIYTCAEKLFKEGNMLEKIISISVLSIIKQYIDR